MGAIGLLGALASLFVLSRTAPPSTSLEPYASVRGAMGAVATWLFLPSLAVVLMAGLVALAATRAFHDAGWAWIKLASGLALFEGGLQAVDGPIRDEAARAASVLGGHPDATAFAIGTEQSTLGILLVIAALNVALGIWRPRLLRLPD